MRRTLSGSVAWRFLYASAASFCSARRVWMGATRMMLPISSFPSCFDLRMMSSAWSQGTLRSLMVTVPCTSSATMMFFLLISAMAPSRFLMSMSLTLKSTLRPVYWLVSQTLVLLEVAAFASEAMAAAFGAGLGARATGLGPPQFPVYVALFAVIWSGLAFPGVTAPLV